jgi:hypothetical protein
MPKTKIGGTTDRALPGRATGRIVARKHADRGQAIEAAIVEELTRIDRWRFARECAKLDAAEERAMAEEGLSLHSLLGK